MINKDRLLYLKIIASASIIGSIYLVYVTKNYFPIFVISVVVLFSLLVFEYIYERFIQDYEHLQKKKISIQSLTSAWQDVGKVEQLEKEVKESTNIYKEALQNLSKKLEQHEELLRAITSRVRPDVELEGKEIKEPVNAVDKAVGWTEKDKEIAKRFLEGKNLNVSTPNEQSSIIDAIEERDKIKPAYLEFINGEDEKVKEFLELYKLAKEYGLKFDINSLIYGFFVSENETLLDVYALKLKKEHNVNIEKFMKYIKLIYESNEPFEYEGKVYKKAVFVYKDCVYVNFAVFRKFFTNYSDEMESQYAKMFGKVLCKSIDWKSGYIKRIFKLNYKGKIANIPFVTIKKSVVGDIKNTEGVKITL